MLARLGILSSGFSVFLAVSRSFSVYLGTSKASGKAWLTMFIGIGTILAMCLVKNDAFREMSVPMK